VIDSSYFPWEASPSPVSLGCHRDLLWIEGSALVVTNVACPSHPFHILLHLGEDLHSVSEYNCSFRPQNPIHLQKNVCDVTPATTSRLVNPNTVVQNLDSIHLCYRIEAWYVEAWYVVVFMLPWTLTSRSPSTFAELVLVKGVLFARAPEIQRD